MKAYSFTAADAAKSKNPAFEFMAECFDPKYEEERNNGAIDIAKIKTRFDKDIERGKFYIETPEEGLVDLVSKCKLAKGANHKVSYDDMYEMLTHEYNLSEGQTKYILAANFQGGIGAAAAGFIQVQASILLEKDSEESAKVTENSWVGNGLMSKIVIDKDKNLSYSACRNFIYDCSPELFSSTALREMVGRKLHSQDFLAVNIKANLGVVGDLTPTSKVEIETAGSGPFAEEMIKRMESIPTDSPQRTPESIVESNHVLSDQLVPQSLTEDQYKEALRTRFKAIISDNTDTSPILMENIKQLESAPEVLSDFLLEELDREISEKKGRDAKLSLESRDEIAENFKSKLSKFISYPDNYTAAKFHKELVDTRASALGANVEKENFVRRIINHIKDIWHGYDAAKPISEGMHTLRERMRRQTSSKHSSAVR